ncbi:hypothetical protein VTP01DRAFT_2067 [Rhizomucor pusillus]|uniref:uncharacterized protein n=1 Tax=Rhizomucor pusillus TaxID=4840 RepID=UPI0037432A4E
MQESSRFFQSQGVLFPFITMAPMITYSMVDRRESLCQTVSHLHIVTLMEVSVEKGAAELRRSAQRNYSEAILYACQQTATDKATKASTLFITDVLSMQPFAIVHDGMEQNTLTHPTVLEQAGGQPQPPESRLNILRQYEVCSCPAPCWIHYDGHMNGQAVKSMPSSFMVEPNLSMSTGKALESKGQRHADLMIGTLTCNASVTSALRLDNKTMPPCVGASTPSFILGSKPESLIFLGKDCVDLALKLTKNKHAISISNTHLLYQARQLASKFEAASIYYLYSASGPLTQAHTCLPYTIFTLAGYGRRGNASAKLFHHIAELVPKRGMQAILNKDFVIELLACSIQDRERGRGE